MKKKFTAVNIRHVVVLCVLMFFFTFIILTLRHQQQSAGLPPAAINEKAPLFQYRDNLKPEVTLQRNGNAERCTLTKDFLFFENDAVKNDSSDVFTIFGTRDDSKLSLKPQSLVTLHMNSIVMETGSARFEMTYQKGTYRVLVPFAVLAIRGTIFDVEVIPGKETRVALAKGKLEIIASNTSEMLLAGESASLSPTGNLTRIFETTTGKQRTFHPRDKSSSKVPVVKNE